MAGLDLSSLKPVQPNQAEATPPAGALDVSTLRPYGTSAPPKGPVEPTTSPIEDLGFAASRVGTAIPHLLEFAADTPQHLGALAQWGVSGEKTGVTADQPKTAATFDQFAKQTLGEPDFERYPSNGYDPKKLGDLYKDFLAAPQNAELAERSRAAKVPQAYRAPMIGTDILGKQLGAAAEGVKQLTGVDLNAAFPEAKNAKQQVIEGLTEGAVTGGTSIPRSIVRGALPALARQAGEKFTAAEASALRREIAADLLTGGVGGATGTMAAQNAPEGWELPAGIAGGLAGGVGAVGAMHGLDTAARKGAEYLRPAFPTKGNVERLAADAARASASNPEKAAVDIASATAPEGVDFTAGQASQDIGLLNLEQTLARGKDQKFKEAMVDRAREQNAAMVENLRRIEEGASPTSMSQFFADRMAQLQARNDQLHDSARKLAQAKADTLEAPDAADVGGGLQDALASEQTRIKDEISALDKAIDPDGSMVLPTRDVRARADEIYANMSPEERLSITPEERAMLDIIKGYGDVLPYQRFRDLRTQLNEDMRNARGAGKNRAYGRLAQLRAALEEDIKAAVENRFSRESNTAQEFVDAARNWYTRSVEGEAGAGAAPRPVAAAAGAPRGVPEEPGASGDQGGVAPATEGDTRLQGDAAARSAVEGGGQFDQQALAGMFRDVEPRALNGLSREQRRVINSATEAKDYVEADLPTNRLLATQEYVNDDFREAAARRAAEEPDGYQRPMVVRVNGKNYVADGHHRIAAAIDRGDSTVPVRFVDVDRRLSGEMSDDRQSNLFDQAAHAAATSPRNALPEPTDAQKAAGNYAKGHIKLGGLDISVENPVGSKRTGTNKAGKRWSVDLKDHYGYVRGSVGKDGDHLDVFVKDGTEALDDSAPVFVVDQIDPRTGRFDETKTMLGYGSRAEAEAAYRANYAKDWKGLGAITPTTMGEFKDWIKSGKTRGQFAKSGRGDPGADRTVAATMSERFAAAGRPEPEARAAGELVDAFYTTMAKRLGKTVEQVQEQFPLPRVDKGGADPSDAPLFQPAYHGSPHIFDKFEWSDKTRGKGEGAQAFGDGLYFAGKKEVAQYYRDTLSKPENLRPDETAIADHKAEWDALVSELDAANAIPYARSTPESRAKWQDISNRMDVLHAKMLDETKSRNPKPGRLYKVDIPGDDELLSWDKPLSEQPKRVQEAIKPLVDMIARSPDVNGPVNRARDAVANGTATGADFYNRLAHVIGEQTPLMKRLGLADDVRKRNEPAASAALREAGIPGHRFLDQGSRYSKDAADLVQRYGTREKALEIARQRADEASIPAHRRDWEKLVKELESEQTHNYVIYDDSKVNILDHEQPSGPDNPRGRIKFDPTGGASLISLFEKADASTALHEAGHQFLHMFRQFATAADAPANITKDWDAAKAWWQQNAKAVATDANGVGGKGVTAEDVRKVLRDQSTGDRMKDLAIDKGLHEQWARAFEVYLRDGKAPNAAMRGVFEQFRDWLTQVYKSITGMGVNLSPDIRSVFDRMLGGEGGSSNLIDADAAKRLKDVTGKWKNYYGTYTDKGAAPVPAIVAKTKGESYGFDLPPESVTKAAWKPGADGATAIRNLLNAAGNRRAEVMQGIEQSAMLSLARSTMKDGVVDPASFDKWKAKHSDALKAVPDLAKRMDSAANASREMNRIAKVNQDHLAAAQRSAAGAILKLGPDADEADIARKVGSMLSQQNGAKQMRELVRLTDGDPDALAGLRRAVVDHAISHFTRDDMMRAGAFSTWLGKNRGALSQALSAEQMQSLNALSAAADRIGRMIRAPGGGSPTVEYLSGLIERGESPSMLMSVLGNVAKNAVQSGLVGLGGHAVAGLGVGVGAAAGSFLSKLGIDALRARGFSKADDLLREAILDPQLMRRLLMKAPKRKGSGAAKELERALTGSITGLLAANRERDRNKQPRDMRPRAEQPKYTPMMGVRG